MPIALDKSSNCVLKQHCLCSFFRFLIAENDEREFDEEESVDTSIVAASDGPDSSLPFSPDTNLQCSKCAKIFSNNTDFILHALYGTHEEVRCEVCNEVFPSKELFQKHKHLPQKVYKCKQCEKSFEKSYQLEKHMLSAHVTEKPFICDVCNKAFKRKDHMYLHREIHTTEKLFLCECGKAFTTKRYLKRHEKTHNRQVIK